MAERLTRERFFEIAQAAKTSSDQSKVSSEMTAEEWLETPEGRTASERAKEGREWLADQRQWIEEQLELTGGDGWDIERVCMEMHELTGLDIFTLMEMSKSYFQHLVQVGIRKRQGDEKRRSADADEAYQAFTPDELEKIFRVTFRTLKSRAEKGLLRMKQTHSTKLYRVHKEDIAKAEEK